MFVLHTHWQPPQRPVDAGGILFWAESSDGAAPERQRGRLPRKFKPKPHPFALSADTLRELIGAGTPLGDARAAQALMRLPTRRMIPVPSPELRHTWDLPEENAPRLMPWVVPGLWLPASKAFSVLANLPAQGPGGAFVLGGEAHYWRVAGNLVLETLAAQKLVPVLVPANGRGQLYHARWMAVLDGPNDAQRLAQLEAVMPPVCRAEQIANNHGNDEDTYSPAALLDSFLKTMCDALARSWSRGKMPRWAPGEESPFQGWLMALFQEDPTVKASPAQLQALNSSLRAWMRNLHAAGDKTFRIAFRLEAPEQQVDANARAWTLHFLLQDRMDPSLLIAADEVWNGGSLTRLGRRYDQPQEKLLAGLGYAARLFPPLLPSLQTSRPNATTMDSEIAYGFLRETAPLLEQAGFGVLVPPWWNKPGARLGVRLHLRPKQDAKNAPLSQGRLSLDNLVSYEWELALGGTALTRQEFEALAALKTPLVQIRGQWVQLDAEQIEAAIQFWERQQQRGDLNLLQAAQFGLGGQSELDGLPVDEVIAEGWVQEWLGRLSQHEMLNELPQPSGLQGMLRPYQRYGYSWLAFFRRWGLGACLADDMGLGKTVQALALLLYEKESQGELSGPVLLVCPTSVVTNWEREVRRFAPGLKTLIHQGAGRLRGEEFRQAVRQVDLVLSSYTVVRLDAENIQAVPWFGVILDEAQNIKNPSAKQTQAVRKLNAGFRLALTGTPVENRLTELWSIMHFLNPGYLGSQDLFRRNYVIPIERFSDAQATQSLRKMVSPFILRRVKTDPRVIQDLPEKIEMKEFCTLTEEQATLYEAVVRDTMEKVSDSDGMARRGLVLSLLMQLKQICNHPAQYLHQGRGDVAAAEQLSGRSDKLNRLAEMLEEILAEDDRVLIFTQFAEMGHMLNQYLPQALGCQTLFLHGGTPAKMRDQMIRRFQEEEQGPPIFILSLKAGGTGLNLTRAQHVFHFDRWWNPAVEDQATDRAFRIGQHRNVQVHKFVTTGTLEEKIDEMIEAKKGLAEAIIGGGEQWLTELSTDALRDLVALRR